jgi:hypothetical protein
MPAFFSRSSDHDLFSSVLVKAWCLKTASLRRRQETCLHYATRQGDVKIIEVKSSVPLLPLHISIGIMEDSHECCDAVVGEAWG